MAIILRLDRMMADRKMSLNDPAVVTISSNIISFSNSFNGKVFAVEINR